MENLVPILDQINQTLKEFSPGLKEITEILGKTFSMDHHLFFIIIAALVGNILGYLIHGVVKSEERKYEVSVQNKNREKQRKLISALLGDEIVLRWNKDKGIAEDFNKIFKNSDVQSLFRTTFKSSDLHTFRQCAHDMNLLTVFDDKAVVSHVIYVYMLSKDLEDNLDDFKKQMTLYLSVKELASIEELTRTIKNQASNHQNYATALISAWNNTKKEFDKLDAKLLEIYKRIEDDYIEYCKDSKFSNENELINIRDNIRKKLPEIADMRLPK
ncbi:hypothetical protein [Nitrosomonas ureae]|uniref:Uncharacterized protein n=1 Tax=Nitrosomonas ureae TaxID=44577 RepID=A0A1H2DYE3_9PROT|nr:hypothetical protein [Nitrosomonas ureae]ALQ50357.1 hypothetical protein ATY38_03370 [Nitrosomonas ureae]SDT87855.1 hypothetical protein SAMN05216406_10776 [Nitrosomonas ureae]